MSSHLTEDLELEKSVVEKVVDEAKAALGLAEVEEKLVHPDVLTGGEVEKKADPKVPVLIKDVHAWKAGLSMSKGARPARDLSEFLEGGAKL